MAPFRSLPEHKTERRIHLRLARGPFFERVVASTRVFSLEYLSSGPAQSDKGEAMDEIRKKTGRLLAAAMLAASVCLGGPPPASAEDSPAACSQVDYGIAPVPAGATLASVAPNPDGPTRVGAALFVTELREIDAVRDDYGFRGYLRATWCDPRLAFDPEPAGPRERVTMGAQAEGELARIWFPAGFPVNRVGSLDISERVLRIHSDGTVQHDLNVSLRVAADFDLRRFPFDRQLLELEIESFRWTEESLVWEPDEAGMGFSEDFEIPEWRIERVGSRVETAHSLRSPDPFSRFVFEIEVERESGFYVWKVMLPLIIIVGLSWSIFWMTEERVAARSRITATGVLTIVAYQFVVGEALPRIAYLTLLDKMMILSFVLLAVTVVQSLLIARYQEDDMPRARRIDRASRWFFPTGYLLLLTLIVTTAGR